MRKKSPPKWVKGFKEIPFGQYKQVNKKGEVIRIEESALVSDQGEFERELYSQIEVKILMSKLPPKQQEAIRLRYIEGLQHREEIAKRMGLTIDATRRNLYLGLQKIRMWIGTSDHNKGSKSYKELLKEKSHKDPFYKKIYRKWRKQQRHIKYEKERAANNN